MRFISWTEQFTNILRSWRRDNIALDEHMCQECQEHNKHMAHEGLKHSPFANGGECVAVHSLGWNNEQPYAIFACWKNSFKHAAIMLSPGSRFGIAFLEKDGMIYSTFRIR